VIGGPTEIKNRSWVGNRSLAAGWLQVAPALELGTAPLRWAARTATDDRDARVVVAMGGSAGAIVRALDDADVATVRVGHAAPVARAAIQGPVATGVVGSTVGLTDVGPDRIPARVNGWGAAATGAFAGRRATARLTAGICYADAGAVGLACTAYQWRTTGVGAAALVAFGATDRAGLVASLIVDADSACSAAGRPAGLSSGAAGVGDASVRCAAANTAA
jgi:hypothetical protein